MAFDGATSFSLAHRFTCPKQERKGLIGWDQGAFAAESPGNELYNGAIHWQQWPRCTPASTMRRCSSAPSTCWLWTVTICVVFRSQCAKPILPGSYAGGRRGSSSTRSSKARSDRTSSARLASLGSKVSSRSIATGPINPAGQSTGSRSRTGSIPPSIGCRKLTAAGPALLSRRHSTFARLIWINPTGFPPRCLLRQREPLKKSEECPMSEKKKTEKKNTMSEKKKTEKTQAQILSDASEGMKGRQPKSDQQLKEW